MQSIVTQNVIMLSIVTENVKMLSIVTQYHNPKYSDRECHNAKVWLHKMPK
jgi:hypothetical protein